MKLIVTMLSLVLFGVWVTARSAPATSPGAVKPEADCFRIKVRFEHGDWSEELKRCVTGKGLCKIVLEVIFTRVVPDEGDGYLWYDGEHLHFVALAETWDPATFHSIYQASTYSLERDFNLSDDVCDALQIPRGYQIMKGEYSIHDAGPGYSNADREIIF